MYSWYWYELLDSVAETMFKSIDKTSTKNVIITCNLVYSHLKLLHQDWNPKLFN